MLAGILEWNKTFTFVNEPRAVSGDAVVELFLKRSSGLAGKAPACAPELKLRLSVDGTKKSELSKSSDAV